MNDWIYSKSVDLFFRVHFLLLLLFCPSIPLFVHCAWHIFCLSDVCIWLRASLNFVLFEMIKCTKPHFTILSFYICVVIEAKNWSNKSLQNKYQMNPKHDKNKFRHNVIEWERERRLNQFPFVFLYIFYCKNRDRWIRVCSATINQCKWSECLFFVVDLRQKNRECVRVHNRLVLLTLNISRASGSMTMAWQMMMRQLIHFYSVFFPPMARRHLRNWFGAKRRWKWNKERDEIERKKGEREIEMRNVAHNFDKLKQ